MTLLDELNDKPRYPVRFGFLGGYLLGAPWWHSDRKRSLLDMATNVRRTVEAEHPNAKPDHLEWLATVRLAAMLDELLDRITAKSVGLMQALSILAAILTIVITRADGNKFEAGWARDVFSYLTLAVTLCTTLLLFTNVGMATRRQKGFFTKRKLLIEDTYAIVLSRAHRLRLAQWLAFWCFLAVSAAAIYLAQSQIGTLIGAILPG